MQNKQEMYHVGKQAGYVWTWWQGDALPKLPEVAHWHVESSDNVALAAKISNLTIGNTEERYEQGHRPYMAYVEQELVAYGWSAVRNAAFGSPNVNFYVAGHNLYLYHFVTMLPWRGRGCYPRLLQEIIRRTQQDYERFWIIHQLSNQASQKGIAKAGFSIANSVFHLDHAGLGLVAGEDTARAQAGAQLLGLPLVTFP
ncbi:hypothetical protein KDA_64860 [Dictyobacter alpinus]|uniref:N-acetyltransferase domain-containing protein n=1 Tax=Dictyobacter alpinus TaxID=2014873 RepID=A0A402BIE2_9CHLR|nr:GNAT family N-acetyltransferase [Dictyobacter alpinus]GCE31002.1 hypothetical protein KDA_64860 [Dictyobacter alpinus]